MSIPITTLYTTIAGTKDDFKIDWKEDAKADWKVNWATGVEPVAPSNSVAPVIAAPFLTVGSVVGVTSNGTWAGTGNAYTFQWRNDAGPIAGATMNSYQLQTSDIAKGIACVVTATNALGAESATSNIVGPVTA